MFQRLYALADDLPVLHRLFVAGGDVGPVVYVPGGAKAVVPDRTGVPLDGERPVFESHVALGAAIGTGDPGAAPRLQQIAVAGRADAGSSGKARVPPVQQGLAHPAAQQGGPVHDRLVQHHHGGGGVVPHQEFVHDDAAFAQVAHRQIHEGLRQIDPVGAAQGHGRTDLGVGAAVALVLLADAQHPVEQGDHRAGGDQVVNRGGQDEGVGLLYGSREPPHIVIFHHPAHSLPGPGSTEPGR